VMMKETIVKNEFELWEDQVDRNEGLELDTVQVVAKSSTLYLYRNVLILCSA
jgi:hypothetical protein